MSATTKFRTISVGPVHACGLNDSGAVLCWGRNTYGQLGDGSTRTSRTPVRVSSSLTFGAVVVGGSHSCALTGDGAAYCWGSDSVGSVGDGKHENAKTPTPVAGGLRFTSLGASATGRTCGITKSGAMYCWGIDDGLGNGSTGRASFTPSAVAGGHAFSSVVVGSDYTCAIDTTGAAHCWGSGSSGRLGNGAEDHKQVPVPVSGGLRFTSLAVSNSVSGDLACGVTVARTIVCWGSADDEKQVGKGFPDGATTPTPIRP